MVWDMVRLAATNIPWGRVLENAPAVADLVARAKDRWQGPSQSELEERLIALQQENRRLERALLETSDQVRELANTLEVVAARQKMLAVVTIITLAIAVFSLTLWGAK